MTRSCMYINRWLINHDICIGALIFGQITEKCIIITEKNDQESRNVISPSMLLRSLYWSILNYGHYKNLIDIDGVEAILNLYYAVHSEGIRNIFSSWFQYFS